MISDKFFLNGVREKKIAATVNVEINSEVYLMRGVSTEPGGHGRSPPTVGWPGRCLPQPPHVRTSWPSRWGSGGPHENSCHGEFVRLDEHLQDVLRSRMPGFQLPYYILQQYPRACVGGGLLRGRWR